MIKIESRQLAALALAAFTSAIVAPFGTAFAADRAADVSTERLLRADRDPSNWPTVGGTYAEARYSTLDKINATNVADLKLAWFGDFDTKRGQEATPLVIDGVLYTSTSWSKVYAFDAVSGKQLWFYDPKVAGSTGPNACCDVVNRGVAAWEGKIYVGTLDGRLVALDAKTGQEVWSTLTVDPSKPFTITGAPRVVKGKVLIGNAGGEFGVRGYISAFDGKTGKQAWRFFLTPNPENKPDGAISDKILMEKAYSTWGNGSWKQTGGGAPAWDAIVFDAEFDQILVGTGSGVPWSRRARSGDKGDNLFVSSVLALDANTGAYKWHYQETPGEEWDFDSAMPMILSDLKIGGSSRKVIMHAPKNGFFYVIDRKDGTLISAKNFTTVNWAAGIDITTGRPIEFREARYSEHGGEFVGKPAAFGSHNWHPMAYSLKTGLVYLPTQEVPFAFTDDTNFKFNPGHGNWNLADVSAHEVNLGPQNEAQRKVLKAMTRGTLIAWDPVQQKEAWRVQHPSVGAGGVFATAGNLVFQGTPDGYFHAYAADTGKELWRYDGQVGIIAGAMSYMVGTDQYIAVLSGLGGAGALHMPYMDNPRAGFGRVLVFKLNGTAKLPPSSFTVQPAQVPPDQWSKEVVAKGGAVYGNCVFCHGFAAISNGVIPDLRRSPMLMSKEVWSAVVGGGALESNGMVNFSKRGLSPEDIEAVRAWVADRARQLQSDEATEELARRNGTASSQ